MITTSKINLDQDKQFKRTWILNGLRKELAKYVALLSSDDLATTKVSACKVEIGRLKKQRMREDSDTKESSNESDEKSKRKKNDTEEEIKALREELEGIALGDMQYRMGVVCWRCQNPGHYVQECQLKQCTNCNSLTHNTNECAYKRHEARRPRERTYGVNQIQPQPNNNKKKKIPMRKELDGAHAKSLPTLEYRRDERPPYPDINYWWEVGGPFWENEYCRDEKSSNGQYYRANDGYRNNYTRPKLLERRWIPLARRS